MSVCIFIFYDFKTKYMNFVCLLSYEPVFAANAEAVTVKVHVQLMVDNCQADYALMNWIRFDLVATIGVD